MTMEKSKVESTGIRFTKPPSQVEPPFAGRAEEEALRQPLPNFAFSLSILREKPLLPLTFHCQPTDFSKSANISAFTLTTDRTVLQIVTIATIKILIKIIKSEKFYLFGVYNILLGIVVLVYSL